MRHYLIYLLLLSLCLDLDAQGLAIGEWRSHLPHQNGRLVTQSEKKIIYATLWDLIIIDKEDQSVDFISKVNGLSDTGIDAIHYDQEHEYLIVAYENSNIDILRDDETTINIPNIKENTTISGDKRIFNIYTADERIFFSTGIGVLQMNAESLSFTENTITNIRVNDVILYDGYVYAAMEDGLYRIADDPQINFSDFSLWELLDEGFGLSSLAEIIGLELSEERLIIGTDDVVYSYDGDSRADSLLIGPKDFNLEFLAQDEGYLIVGYRDDAFSSQVHFWDGVERTIVGGECVSRVLDALIDERGRVWYGEEFPGIRYADEVGQSCQTLSYDSPYHHSSSDIDVQEGIVYVAEGGVTDNFQYLFSRQGYYIRDENGWENFNEFNTSAIRENELLSMYRTAAHPSDERVYVGSFWGGLLEMSADGYQVFRQENSSLEGAVGDEARERISGLAFDRDENLWITTHGAARPLHVYTATGEWYSFAIDGSMLLSDLIIDEQGRLWMTIGGTSGGVIVYDPGEDITSSSDDRQIYLNSSNTELPTNRIYAATEDRDGDIWIGSSEGPVIFDCGDDIWTGECTGVRRKVLQDSIAAFLLADQQIRCIEVDGANQKWFGTSNGVFVQSADGDDQIAHYTADNSPLFDDQINAMAYDGESGEMYIGTDKGMLSIKTNSTNPENRHRAADVHAYPNPVAPDYVGPIAIRGLTEDAEVKITDINGHLVYQTTALGGQAIWDGQNQDGKRVTAGVYLVFSSESSSFRDPDAFVTKIMVLR